LPAFQVSARAGLGGNFSTGRPLLIARMKVLQAYVATTLVLLVVRSSS
jgi:hypothetical protein